MILSHHGELEFGSPKIPLFPEALLLHLLDNMDSKMECMRALIDRDTQVTGEWTGFNSALDRSALKKSRYLGGSPEAVVETPVAPKPAPRAAEPASVFADKLKGALGKDVTGNNS
jgi:3'-5' exoribonuclease